MYKILPNFGKNSWRHWIQRTELGSLLVKTSDLHCVIEICRFKIALKLFFKFQKISKIWWREIILSRTIVAYVVQNFYQICNKNGQHKKNNKALLCAKITVHINNFTHSIEKLERKVNLGMVLLGF